MIAKIDDDDEDEHDDNHAEDDDDLQHGNEPQVQIWCEAKTFCLGHPCLWRPSPDNNTRNVMVMMKTRLCNMMVMMAKTL